MKYLKLLNLESRCFQFMNEFMVQTTQIRLHSVANIPYQSRECFENVYMTSSVVFITLCTLYTLISIIKFIVIFTIDETGNLNAADAL